MELTVFDERGPVGTVTLTAQGLYLAVDARCSLSAPRVIRLFGVRGFTSQLFGVLQPDHGQWVLHRTVPAVSLPALPTEGVLGNPWEDYLPWRGTLGETQVPYGFLRRGPEGLFVAVPEPELPGLAPCRAGAYHVNVNGVVCLEYKIVNGVPLCPPPEAEAQPDAETAPPCPEEAPAAEPTCPEAVKEETAELPCPEEEAQEPEPPCPEERKEEAPEAAVPCAAEMEPAPPEAAPEAIPEAPCPEEDARKPEAAPEECPAKAAPETTPEECPAKAAPDRAECKPSPSEAAAPSFPACPADPLPDLCPPTAGQILTQDLTEACDDGSMADMTPHTVEL